jgi:transcriptional repressor NrdR
MKKIESIVDKIENSLEKTGKTEVPSSDIGKFVMAELYELDEVAYVRFASVYRKFKDISEFISEVKEIESKTDIPGKDKPAVKLP